MSPGLLSSELAMTFPYQQQKSMDESLFPPIARKSAISLSSESDPSEYCNNISNRSSTTRGSVPASLSSSPVKFPTIDRSNSTSIASLPGSRSTRHRSNIQELRSSYCRSPSCPSHLDITREYNRSVDYNLFKKDKGHKSETECSEVGHTDNEEGSARLPNIFSKDFSARIREGKSPNRREKAREARDRSNTLTLRRSESFMHAFNPSSENATPLSSSRDNEPRQNQAAALLLPIRTTNTQTNKKKKKRRPRMSSDSDGETLDSTPRNYPADFHKPRLPLGRDSDDALNAIARENDMYDDDHDSTPRAIEITSSRKVKQWINNNQKEAGQIKA